MTPLKVVFHPHVFKDVDRVMSYYGKSAGEGLARDFYDEFIALVRLASERPEVFNERTGKYRRVNLKRFPYNFLFHIAGDNLQILVVRHHARQPSFGTRRR